MTVSEAALVRILVALDLLRPLEDKVCCPGPGTDVYRKRSSFHALSDKKPKV